LGLPGRAPIRPADGRLSMALAARCPHCDALFRVVADQLKLRGGLVRCGACRQVFDAIGSLSYVADQALSIAPSEPPLAGGAMPGPAAFTASAALEGQPLQASPAARVSRPSRSAERPERAEQEINEGFGVPTVLGPMPTDLPSSSPGGFFGGTEVLPEQSAVAAPDPVEASQTAFDPSVAAEPAQPDRQDTPDQTMAAETGQASTGEREAASFLLEQETPVQQRLRWAATAACAPLAVLAVFQAMLAFRQPLMEAWPEIRPAVVRGCSWYGCSAGWPAHAEMLAVVGSELAAIPGTDIVELNASVRSRAGFTVALPAIEVTLTDLQNRTIARKVFLPVDYLASSGEPSSRIDEGIAPNSDLSIRLLFEARGLTATGFVIYPFYL